MTFSWFDLFDDVFSTYGVNRTSQHISGSTALISSTSCVHLTSEIPSFVSSNLRIDRSAFHSFLGISTWNFKPFPVSPFMSLRSLPQSNRSTFLQQFDASHVCRFHNRFPMISIHHHVFWNGRNRLDFCFSRGENALKKWQKSKRLAQRTKH